MSKIEVDQIDPQSGTNLTVGSSGDTVTVTGNVVKSNALQASDGGNLISQSGTTITLGASGDTITFDTSGSETLSGSGFLDTELGLYSASGLLIVDDDDGFGNSLSQISRTLSVGTYYIAGGGYNTNFNNSKCFIFN